MKTSNKLLLGALIILVVAMISSNLLLKNEINRLKKEVDKTENNTSIELKETTDSIKVDMDTMKNNIKINIE